MTATRSGITARTGPKRRREVALAEEWQKAGYVELGAAKVKTKTIP